MVANTDYTVPAINSVFEKCRQFPDVMNGKSLNKSDTCKKAPSWNTISSVWESKESERIWILHYVQILSPDQCYAQIVNWWKNTIQIPDTQIAKYCLIIPSERGLRLCLDALSIKKQQKLKRNS